MTAIEYKGVCKSFPGGHGYAVDHVSAEIREGEFVTILGSSGCGKTTLLKMTNRLYEPDEGSISLFGQDIAGRDPIALRRGIGYVIQQVGLFPHMTVEANIALLPGLLGWDKARTRDRVTELLALVGLARALAAGPRLMLLDEPFGAIDAITRTNLQNELLRIHKETGGTYLLVTHDINEAFRLGDRVMVMDRGRLLRFGTPREIVTDPADGFVASLIASAREQEKFWEGVL